VKITHITQCTENSGTKLEETAEYFEDIENEDIVIKEINNKESEKDEIFEELTESFEYQKLYLKKNHD